jgi:predicted metal-dependent peptidase
MLMLGKQLNPEQRMSKAVIDIMGNPKYIALAGVMMIGNREVKDGVPTAYTNGRDEVYGTEFVDKLNDAELRGLVLHECYHKLYRHLTTWRHLYDKNPTLANMACDYVINIKIADDNKDGFAKLPDGGLLDEKYRDMDSAQVYNLLREELSDEEIKRYGQGSTDEHGWDDARALSDDEKRELAREIDEAIRQGALAAGKYGTGGDRDFRDLLETKVNWREVLREFIQTTCSGNSYSTWRRPNRRFISSGVYMPSGIDESVGELVVAIDTSGSIGGKELGQFLGEVKAICDTVKPERVRVLYWDTQVCGEEVYEQDELDRLITSTKPKGGGGTDVTCVGKHIRDTGIKSQAAIVLTDGYLGNDWGDWSIPVLWCIVGNRSATPSVGSYVHVDD